VEFTWPLMRLAVLLVPLLWAGNRLLARRQQRTAERFAEARLFDQLVVRPPSWQRSIPVACYLIAVLFLSVAMARPVAAVPLPVNRAAVVVAIDTSKSMTAPDIPPTRLDAAKAAARAFANMVPRSTKVGLVTFSEYGTTMLAPSIDRQVFFDALDRIQAQTATSVGGGILEAVRVLPGRARLLGDRLDQLARRGGGPQPQPPNPLEPRPDPNDLAPASIIIFSDGVSNFGPDPYESAALAREGKVRIFTVGVGTPGGAVVQIDRQMVLAPFDSSGLERIAQITDGRYFPSTAEEELQRVYKQLSRVIGWERARMEVSFLMVAVAGLFVLSGGTMSLLWFRRVP
jgi:Ca-activated chloride channel family protein